MLITQRLLDLQAALLKFRINGFEGVEVAFDALVGTAVMHPEAGGSKLGQRCVKFWHNVLSLAEGIKALAGTTEATVKTIEAASDAVDKISQ